jgi:hypothetical protein
VPARERLGVGRRTGGGGAGRVIARGRDHGALERGALLERLGLRVEARFELDRISRDAEGAVETIPATAEGFARLGYTARAYRLALRSADSSLLRLAYPIPRRADLFDEARIAGVDPLLAASIIRQESGFEPSARSVADARGLMQVVPSVGAAFAKVDGLRDGTPRCCISPRSTSISGSSIWPARCGDRPIWPTRSRPTMPGPVPQIVGWRCPAPGMIPRSSWSGSSTPRRGTM